MASRAEQALRRLSTVCRHERDVAVGVDAAEAVDDFHPKVVAGRGVPVRGLLRHLEELGLIPGAQIEIKAYSPYDHNLTIKVGRKTTVLGLNVTSKIFIEES